MADKTPSAQVNKNTVKNPLLSSSVVGLSLEDLTNRAVLLPVAPNSALQSTQDANTDPPPPKPVPHPITAPATATAPSKDDFFFEEYLNRLQNTRLTEQPVESKPAETTRYISAPINAPVDNNCNVQPEALEEINLNEESPQHSLTADIAQNFSQLPSVLPQVASAVFSSFSSMLGSRSREQTPDDALDPGYHPRQDAGYPGARDIGYSGVGVPSAGYQGEGLDRGHVELRAPEQEVVAPLEPPFCGPPTTFRIATKKKAYAQIPGLSTHQTAPVPGFGSGQSSVPPNVFVPNFTEDNAVSQPSHEFRDYAQGHTVNPTLTPIARPVQEDVKNENKDVTDNANRVDLTIARRPSFGHEIRHQNDDSLVPDSNAPIVPPPTFPKDIPPPQKLLFNSSGTILPPSVKRRLAGNQPIMKATDSNQPVMPNFFVPVLNKSTNDVAQETPYSLVNTPVSLVEAPPSNLTTAPSIWPDSAPCVGSNVPQTSQNPPVPPNLWTSYQAPERNTVESSNSHPTSVYNSGIIPPGNTVVPPTSNVAEVATHPPTFFNPISSQAEVRPSQETINALIVNPPILNAPTEPVKVPEPPKFAGSGVNYRMTKKRPQYYSGPIEGIGSISNNMKPTLPPVEMPTGQHMDMFNPNQYNNHQQTMLPAAMDNATAPFDISRPIGSLTQPLLSSNQIPSIDHHATAFDLSRSTTENYEPKKQEPIGFGLIGSLKSKLGSIDINKIQNTVTTFFDPAFNEDKSANLNSNQNFGPNTNEVVGQCFNQGLEIHVASPPTNFQQTFDHGYANQTYNAPQYPQYSNQYNPYQQTTANYPSTSNNPNEAHYGISTYQGTKENTNFNPTTYYNDSSQQVPQTSFFGTQISTAAVVTESPNELTPFIDHLGRGDTEFHQPDPSVVNTVSSIHNIIPAESTNSNLTDGIYDPQRQSSLMPLFHSSNDDKEDNVSILENAMKAVTLDSNVTNDELHQQCTVFFGKYPNRAGGDNFDTDYEVKQAAKESDELSICGSCREIDSPVEKNVPEDLTNQLIENITAPIQLSNPVEVPMTETNEVMDGNFEYTQCIGYAKQILTTEHSVTGPGALPVKQFGWTDTPPESRSMLLDRNYTFEVDPNAVGFFSNNSLFFDNIPKNASDEIKAEMINAQDDIVTSFDRQMSIPTAPPMENLEDVNNDEAGALDVLSIEQDANDDFLEEFVIEPSETDDDKIETREKERTSDDPVPEIDSFTNRVEKFKQSEETSDHKDVKVTEEIAPCSPVITMASYFDTGNYAADTHYRNSLTSPSTLGAFSVSSPNQNIPPLPSFHQSDYNELNFDTVSILGAPYEKNEDFKLIAPPSSHKLEDTSKKGMASEPKLYHKDNFNLFPKAGHEMGGCSEFYNFDHVIQANKRESTSPHLGFVQDTPYHPDKLSTEPTPESVKPMTDAYLRKDSTHDSITSVFSNQRTEDQQVPFYATDYDIDPVAAGVQEILEFHSCQTLTDHTTTFTYSRSQEITRTDPITSRQAMFTNAGYTSEFAASSASAYFDNILDANQNRMADQQNIPDIFAITKAKDNSPANVDQESKVDRKADNDVLNVRKTSPVDAALIENKTDINNMHPIRAAFEGASRSSEVKIPDCGCQTDVCNTVSYSQTQNPLLSLHGMFSSQRKSISDGNVTLTQKSQTDASNTTTFSQEQKSTTLQDMFASKFSYDNAATRSGEVPYDQFRTLGSNTLSGLAQTSAVPTQENLPIIAPASQTYKPPATQALPDPMAFFSAQEPAKEPEGFNRLASYFSSPPKEANAKSFFELSQSQNHLRHDADNLTADRYSATLDLMKDLTSVQNYRPPEEQVVRTVNYLFVEYDKTATAGQPTINNPSPKIVDEVEQNTDARKPFFSCVHCYNLMAQSARVDVKTNTQFRVKEAMDSGNNGSKSGGLPTSNAETPAEGHTVTFDIPIDEDQDESVSVTPDERAASEYSPVEHHWFYRVDVEGKSVWKGFSMGDSKRLEEMFQSPALTEDTLVPTDGGRYDVNIMGRLRLAVYWNEKPTNVRRCSWFYKGHTDARYVPYSEDIAEKLEEEYRRGVTTGEWHRRLSLPNNEAVVMHAPSVMVHFLQSSGSDAWGAPSIFSFNKKVYRSVPGLHFVSDACEKIDHVILLVHGAGEWSRCKEKIATSRPRVRRGAERAEIADEEPSAVGHLLLMTHGVGSACDMRFRAIEDVVDDFRATTLQLIQAHYKNSYDQGTVGRVEVLPISWHSCVHRGAAGVDRRLARLTLASIPRLRAFTNDTVLDVLLYTSPVFCQTIMDTVCSEMNRVHALFLSRNPRFTGGVSLGGHSLGSVILYDLLCHQTRDQSSAGKQTVAGAAGTGQASVRYPRLQFTPHALYALGSPIAIFECIRGVESLGEQFCLPGDINFFNIFHPYDPIAYRIEPLINPKLQHVQPFLIPHHKGRKRMHLELKETVARFSADLRQRLVESVKATWYNMWRGPTPTTEQLAKVVEEELEKEELNEESKIEVNDEEEPSPELFGKLNKGRRVDYVLQEAPFEMINEYLFAMSSHVCYWESEDTMLMILREIYGRMNVTPDSSLPPPSMSVSRARRDEATTSAGHD